MRFSTSLHHERVFAVTGLCTVLVPSFFVVESIPHHCLLDLTRVPVISENLWELDIWWMTNEQRTEAGPTGPVMDAENQGAKRAVSCAMQGWLSAA